MTAADFIAPEQEKELKALRSGRIKASRIVVAAILSLLTVWLLLPNGSKNNSERGIDTAEAIFYSGRTESIIEAERNYRSWIQEHGYGFELYLFESGTSGILKIGAALGKSKESGFSLSIISGAIQLLFAMIAAFRFWIFAALAAYAWNFTSRAPHCGNDLLGQTGNGRLFFSGIRAGLDKVNKRGVPDKQIVGLIALNSVGRGEVLNSEIYKILDRFNAVNETNISLAAYILSYKNYPAYVAAQEEEQLLAKFFETGAVLEKCAAMSLKKCLALHAAYRGEGSLDGEPDGQRTAPINLEGYSELLESALHRVLTLSLRDSLAELKPSMVASMVLAVEAGKILTFAHEGGKWLRKSSFPQLNARAVIHSIAAYGDEYDVDDRTTLRRGIIYADRNSGFGPVRFPVDLSEASRSLRQWGELLMAPPHRLQATADEVELYGIVCESQARWRDLFLTRAMALDAETVDDAFASRSNMLFLPIKKVLASMREVVDPAARKRLEELVAAVSQRQKLDAMSREFALGGSDPNDAPKNYERILPPLSFTEQKSLASIHGLTMDEIRDWSAFRVILESFSWLGRRVGDYTVPANSVIFCVFKVAEGVRGRNEHGLAGMPGMVALRGSRLEERWGKFWSSRFTQADDAKMAETREDFDRLMQGLKDSEPEENDSNPAVGQ